MNTAFAFRKATHLFKDFVKDQYRLILPLIVIFALPSLVKPLITVGLLSSNSLFSSFAGIVLSILVSIFYPLGSLSLSLATYAWLMEKKSSLKDIFRSLNSVAGYAISTYIGQAIILIVPIALVMVLLLVLHASSSVKNILLPLFTNTLYSFLFFFTWPLFIIKRIFGIRNATACIRLTASTFWLISISILVPIIWLFGLLLLTMKSSQLLREIIIAPSYLLLFPLSALEMCVYKAIYPADFDISIERES